MEVFKGGKSEREFTNLNEWSKVYKKIIANSGIYFDIKNKINLFISNFTDLESFYDNLVQGSESSDRILEIIMKDSELIVDVKNKDV